MATRATACLPRITEMNVDGLRARGFRYQATLPKAFTYCVRCINYTWFGWWGSPTADGIKVAACDKCGYVPADEARHAERYPVTKAKAS